MSKSDLLKEAIADAKAVRETALANAKIALEEAFSPRLQQMLSTKLAEELDDEEEEMQAEPEMDAPAPEAEPEMDMEPEAGMDMPAGEPAAAPEAEPGDVVGNAEVQADLDGDGQSPDTVDMIIPGEEEEMEAEPGMEGDEEDLDLEAIIRELEEDLAEGEYSNEEEDPMYEAKKEDEEEKEEIDEDVQSILNSLLGESEEEEEGAEAAEEVEESTEAAEDGSGMDLVEEKEAELQEAYSTIKDLQKIIQEVNLLNAKLLYTNKLFRNFELSESKKMKVLDTFDRAGTTREVKLVFSALAESFQKPSKKRVVKEHKATASKASGTTMPTKEVIEENKKQIIDNGSDLAARFKKLANL